MLQVDLIGIQVDPHTGAAVLVLREHDAPNRLLPIVVGGAEAASIALAAQGQVLPRPMTHDLMATLVERFDGHLDAVEVVDFQEGAFIANLAVSGPTGELRLDTRPSDAIALAVRLHAPLFVSEHVLDEAGAYPEPEGEEGLDEAQIDAEVDQFRDFLDQLAPEDFTLDAVDTIDAEIVDAQDAFDADTNDDANAARDDLDADIVDAEIVEEPPDPDAEPED
jgi:bifunctional DNase/RNase